MDIYLLKLIGSWLSVLVVSLTSFLGIDDYKEKASNLENTSYTKTVSVENKIIPYQIKYVYNPDKASTADYEVLVEGEDGINYTYENGITKVLKEPVNKVIEIGTGRAGEYVGRLTNYGGDCLGCSKTAVVACRTKNGKSWSLFKNGIYYPDDEYGKVRIIAADLGGFPCGTIIEVKSSNLGDFMGIVMDTGYTMREKLKEGIYHFDVAYQTEKDENIRFATNMSGNVEFNVQRWGW